VVRKRGDQLVVGFSQGVMNHPFRIANVESMKSAARAAGVRLLVTDGKGSTEVETENMNWLLDQGVDALVVSSLSGPAIYPTYRRVGKWKVPLVLFASGVPDDDTPYTAFVAADEMDMGARAATFIGERLGGQGRIVVVRGVTESSNSRLRSAGFEAALSADFPAIDVVSRESGEWLRRPAFEVATRTLSAFDGIEAVFAENDEMALGVVDALRRHHRQSEAFVVGLDGQREAVWEIGLGPPFVMTIKIEWNGTKALDIALAAARGDDVPRQTVLDAPRIDVSNAARFLDEEATI